ncbi:MAG TPA: hypothetical protein ENJ65_03675 [Candidatus Tenderia electrophaga]|uniref:Uncharacterized protein n=1 Tax=Candidatus Tenderia electrophaga TaxID=1748243 RepID=A0A832J518_9GAMM|nr:hypothetical protein [Candidatus Tenderia electrophaga]
MGAEEVENTQTGKMPVLRVICDMEKEMSENEMAMRLVMRQEGEFWNAYLAKIDTMDDSILLGSIRMSAVDHMPELRTTFMGLMREMLSEFLGSMADCEVEWDEVKPAPEHERTGNA